MQKLYHLAKIHLKRGKCDLKTLNIKIKGTPWKIDFIYGKNKKFLGRTDYYKKTITICTKHNKTINESIFHELYHAFCFECGFDRYYCDENLIHFLGRISTDLFSLFLTIHNKTQGDFEYAREKEKE